MEARFKVGDRVRIGKNCSSYLGMIGTVTEAEEDFYALMLDEKQECPRYFYGTDLELLSPKPEPAVKGVSPDAVNHPAHYTQGKVECIDAIESALTPEEFRGYCKGNIIKYIWREREKEGDVSLEKSAWYLKKAVKHDKP